MATHDYDIANAAGSVVRTDLNNVLDAILTNNSSTVAGAPTGTGRANYMWWFDTDNNIMKMRNDGDDAWISVLSFDFTADNVEGIWIDGVLITTPADTAIQQEWTKQQNFNATTLTDAATIAWNTDDNQVCSVTITASRTMGLPTNMNDGSIYSLTVIQGGAGNFDITWDGVFKFPGGTAPSLSTAASARDEFTFKSDGTNMYELGRNLDVK